jgi:hypothetical protein
MAWYRSAASAADETTYTLYRNSVLDLKMRIHVASFDTDNGGDYNIENCNLVADLMKTQDGVTTRFWY